MPATTCSTCGTATALPPDWPYPGYTCPGCNTAVALNPFALDDEPRRPRYRRKQESDTGILVLGGYLCAALALLFFPPALGLAGLIFGAFAIARGATGNGMVIVVLSPICATVGWILGELLVPIILSR